MLAQPLTLALVRQALARPLPGLPGQLRMAPVHRMDPGLYAKGSRDCRRAAVLLLLYPHPVDLHLLLIERPRHLPDHPGQVAFPGGARDEAETVEQTALREAYEEVGLAPAQVELLGRLSHLYIPPSNFCVQVVVGYTSQRPLWRPNPHEVASLLEVSLAHFCDLANWQAEVRAIEGVPRRIPYFAIGEHKVWGATAMALAEFVTALEEADESTTR